MKSRLLGPSKWQSKYMHIPLLLGFVFISTLSAEPIRQASTVKPVSRSTRDISTTKPTSVNPSLSVKPVNVGSKISFLAPTVVEAQVYKGPKQNCVNSNKVICFSFKIENNPREFLSVHDVNNIENIEAIVDMSDSTSPVTFDSDEITDFYVPNLEKRALVTEDKSQINLSPVMDDMFYVDEPLNFDKDGSFIKADNTFRILKKLNNTPKYIPPVVTSYDNIHFGVVNRKLCGKSNKTSLSCFHFAVEPEVEITALAATDKKVYLFSSDGIIMSFSYQATSEVIFNDDYQVASLRSLDLRNQVYVKQFDPYLVLAQKNYNASFTRKVSREDAALYARTLHVDFKYSNLLALNVYGDELCYGNSVMVHDKTTYPLACFRYNSNSLGKLNTGSRLYKSGLIPGFFLAYKKPNESIKMLAMAIYDYKNSTYTHLIYADFGEKNSQRRYKYYFKRTNFSESVKSNGKWYYKFNYLPRDLAFLNFGTCKNRIIGLVNDSKYCSNDASGEYGGCESDNFGTLIYKESSFREARGNIVKGISAMTFMDSTTYMVLRGNTLAVMNIRDTTDKCKEIYFDGASFYLQSELLFRFNRPSAQVATAMRWDGSIAYNVNSDGLADYDPSTNFNNSNIPEKHRLKPRSLDNPMIMAITSEASHGEDDDPFTKTDGLFIADEGMSTSTILFIVLGIIAIIILVCIAYYCFCTSDDSYAVPKTTIPQVNPATKAPLSRTPISNVSSGIAVKSIRSKLGSNENMSPKPTSPVANNSPSTHLAKAKSVKSAGIGLKPSSSKTNSPGSKITNSPSSRLKKSVTRSKSPKSALNASKSTKSFAPKILKKSSPKSNIKSRL